MTDPDDPGGAGSTARVSIANEQEHPVDLDALEALAVRALDALAIPDGRFLSVALVTAGRIAELNAHYASKAGPTDVLSFVMDPPDAPAPAVLGDVVICVDVAEGQARALGRTLSDELAQLLVHGILHLTGHDHADASGEVAMAAAERRVLRAAHSMVSR